MSLITLLGVAYGAALGRRHRPRSGSPRSYRSCLRLDFSFTCVYCLTREAEVSHVLPFGGFEVEHFRPASRFKRLRKYYTNLVWSCEQCNAVKSDRWPSVAEWRRGFRFVDPVRENMSDHLIVDGIEVHPKGGSSAGAFTIEELQLNGQYHRDLRDDRINKQKIVEGLKASIGTLEAGLSAVAPDKVPAISEQIRVMQDAAERLSPRPNHVPSACRCRPKITTTKRAARSKKARAIQRLNSR